MHDGGYRRMTTLKDIAEATAGAFGVTIFDLVSPSRLRPIAHARFAAYRIARDAGFSTPMIGRHLGNRDASTVNLGSKRVDDLAFEDLDFRAKYDDARTVLRKPRFVRHDMGTFKTRRKPNVRSNYA